MSKKRRKKKQPPKREVVGETWPPGRISEVPKSWAIDIDFDPKRNQ